MSDIAMCKNDKCPKSKKCYRFMAKPSEYKQSFMFFVHDETGCSDYLKLWERMLRYRTTRHDIEIIECEIVSESKHFVFFPDGRREGIRTDWQTYFNTFDEAKNYLVERTQNKIDSLKYQLEREKSDLEKIMNLEGKNVGKFD